MTSEEIATADPTTGEAETSASLEQLIGRIARAMQQSVSNGDLSDLRRSREGEGLPPAFWRIASYYIEPAGWGGDHGTELEETETRWSAILAILALLVGFHDASQPLGRSLAECRFSELRFSRLLRASDMGLRRLARDCGRYLSSKGARVNVAELARLLLSDGRSNAESVRRSIARDYYRSLATN
jgi:CRISPR type I-E-associated protein CasB/Cse2